MKIQTTHKQSIPVTWDAKVPAAVFDGKTITLAYDPKDKDTFAFRKAIREVAAIAKTHRIPHLAFDLSLWQKALPKKHPQPLPATLAQELALAAYQFTRYKTPPKEGFPAIQTLVLFGATREDLAQAKEALARVEVVNHIRDIINTPGEYMKPQDFVREARKLLKGLPVAIKVLGKKDLEKEKMGAHLAVAQGAASEPKLLVLSYLPNKKKEAPTLLVGKGVTYDTGGLGLKPAEYMLGMHMDMAGAAVALGTVALLAKEKAPRNVVAVIPLAENALGSKSYRQGDIVHAKDGTFIEIRHTDAEGRLLLADALVYGQEKYKPQAIVDIATLTGAAMVALGTHTSALFTNTPDFARSFLAAQEAVGQRLWELPVLPEHEEDIKSKVADITNSTQTRYGGACTAAAFLKHFIKDNRPWVHLDIAPRMEATPYDKLAVGATGEPVLLLQKVLTTVEK